MLSCHPRRLFMLDFYGLETATPYLKLTDLPRDLCTVGRDQESISSLFVSLPSISTVL